MSVTDRPVHPPSASASETGEPEAETSAALSPDETFHILQTFRRRESIRYLLREDGPVKMRDVAEHVAVREHETTVAELTSAQRQRVYIPLYQSHLPKLDTAGVIEYDKPRGIVRPTDRLESFRPYLEAATTPTDAEFGRADREAASNGRRQSVAALGAIVAVLFSIAASALEASGVILGAVLAALVLVAVAVF
ncbi:hypothetical protein Htur_3002 [Haloterrigena turkmenica DSM 5511]|uniref:DUF7344 domain-containing protein n=1 Tax=Haloterrigena turkmenica (strain ATCC 51198 / DSM 5511 / JCM 9101 / NCIMB 13204 / VKM B-1734 / 4k) TaxID=543526 RepID=D2RYC4_HALTV|nr:hypothetical protein [Haloterrigena turkmenica]ADB61870.1 hypothetical protein Htur_3002 [Haloterrigena turkmenica DSM 5511]